MIPKEQRKVHDINSSKKGYSGELTTKGKPNSTKQMDQDRNLKQSYINMTEVEGVAGKLINKDKGNGFCTITGSKSGSIE